MVDLQSGPAWSWLFYLHFCSCDKNTKLDFFIFHFFYFSTFIFYFSTFLVLVHIFGAFNPLSPSLAYLILLGDFVRARKVEGFFLICTYPVIFREEVVFAKTDPGNVELTYIQGHLSIGTIWWIS